MPGEAGANDEFGRTMAAGDFNADGYVDLAVGTLSDDAPGVAGAGTVTVLRGSSKGLGVSGVRLWTQDSPGVDDRAEGNDGFGQALVSDDFNGDGIADLAVGSPYEGFPPVTGDEPFDPGVVHVLFGSRGEGLGGAGSQYLHQDSPEMPEDAEHQDRFGAALAAGDLDGDGIADLIVGAPGEKRESRPGAGIVHVLFGSRSGVVAAGSRVLSQGTAGIPDQPDEADGFGTAAAAS